MAKHNPKKHVYNVTKVFKQVRHYQSDKELAETDILTSTINISRNRFFNKSKDAKYFLRIRNGKRWSKTTTSGLRLTTKSYLFFGDKAVNVNGMFKKTHLLIFKFNSDRTKLQIDVYNFYPRNSTELFSILSNY